jgi:hypothetical protein
MNRTCFCLVFSALLFFYGCVEHLSRAQSREQKANPQAITGKTNANLSAIALAKAEFPHFLVGVWQANAFNWAFKFEPDGKISKLTHVLGVPMKVDEGSYYEKGIENSQFLYVLGPCDTSYDPKTGVLKVSIVMDYFLMDMPPAGTLEGSEKDTFEGPVSEKDLTWNVKWRSYATVEGASPPDVNAIDANPEPLVFRKIDLERFEEHKHQPAPPVRPSGE